MGNNTLSHLSRLISGPYERDDAFWLSNRARTAVQLIPGYRTEQLLSPFWIRSVAKQLGGRHTEITQGDSCAKDLGFQMAFQLALHAGLSSPATGSYGFGHKRASCTSLFQQALVCTARNWPLALSGVSISGFSSSREFRELVERRID